MQFVLPKFCPEALFEEVKQYISKFSLDNRELHAQDFMVLEKNEHVLAFARVRHYEAYAELCSLGVIEEARNKGLAKKLVAAFTTASKEPLYLVSVIPEFFEQLGFEICTTFPEKIAEKLAYCKNELCCIQNYVVMRLKA